MNQDEARILHGLYFHREIVGEDMIYTAAEINWLAITPIPKTRNWQNDDGKLKLAKSEGADYLAEVSATSAAAARPLAYLQACGYITYQKNGGHFQITVTGYGADLARELNTFWGRVNIKYKQHKDGVLWFIATVLVSVVTTLVTKYAS